MIHEGRHTADYNEDFVVFLIGMRAHRVWKVWEWLPIARSMGAMQREIAEHPEIGCMHIENFGALKGISVQYWKSFEHLERFARSDEWSHLPAWRSFNKLVRDSGEIGIWHETYRVKADQFEVFYGNMPRFGFGMVGHLRPAGRGSTAARRVGAREDDVAPVEAY